MSRGLHRVIELAAAQSRYLALQTEAQTARQNYDRTAKLVKISPASNAELDQALAALKIADAELVEHHKHHDRTAKLLEIGAVSREEYEMATTKLATAEANVIQAKNRYDRAVQVAEINPVSRGEFELLTLGTLAIIVAFAVVGYWAGTAVRSQTVDIPLEGEAATVTA